jgi:hypothetical protein
LNGLGAQSKERVAHKFFKAVCRNLDGHYGRGPREKAENFRLHLIFGKRAPLQPRRLAGSCLAPPRLEKALKA